MDTWMNVLRPLLILAAVLFTGQAGSAIPDAPLHSAYFSFDSDALSDDDRKTIASVAQALSHTRRGLRLVGYTDDTGPMAYNANLAQRRAASVRDALIAAGYPRQLLRVESRPGMTTTGKRAQLRRVDIIAADPSTQANIMPFGRMQPDATAADPLRVGRYSVIAPVPSEAQRDP
ncbi:MAG TPA: OmpA family protein, partial [Chromatiaceae bacterium]|nr:OmpA family protein [Chromatiaceae bacterium]